MPARTRRPRPNALEVLSQVGWRPETTRERHIGALIAAVGRAVACTLGYNAVLFVGVWGYILPMLLSNDYTGLHSVQHWWKLLSIWGSLTVAIAIGLLSYRASLDEHLLVPDRKRLPKGDR